MDGVEALRDVAAKIAERSRREQGLPRHIEDRAALDHLAALLDVEDAPLEKAS